MTEERLKEICGIVNGTELFHVQRENEAFVDAVVRAGAECNVVKAEVEEVLAGQIRKAA
jgi:hypothetical protein